MQAAEVRFHHDEHQSKDPVCGQYFFSFPRSMSQIYDLWVTQKSLL